MLTAQRNNVFLQNKEQAYLLPIIKDLGSLSYSGVPPLKYNPQLTQASI